MSNSQNIKPAKKCYEHLGGKLGELLLKHLLRKNGLQKKNLLKSFSISQNWEKKSLKNWV